MKRVSILLVSLILIAAGRAQQCSCTQLLTALITKTETDYAGYIHKVKEQDSTQYVKLKAELKKRSAHTSFNECYDVLNGYVNFFKDGHLFVVEFPDPTEQQSDSLSKLVKTYPLAGNYEVLLNNKKDRDPIEGIWGDGFQQIAIVKISKNKFLGVVQKTSSPKWKPGMIKMEIRRTGDNRYDIVYTRGDFASIHFSGERIYKRIMLPFGVYRFSKLFPADPENQYINPVDPQLPVIKPVDKNTLLLTIPSALIDGRYLDSILLANEKRLFSTENLLIDIRGNTGGNNIWGSLYEIANTIVYPEKKDHVEDDFLMLASEDDAAYISNLRRFYEQPKDSSAIKYYDAVIDRIKKNKGSIIGFSFYRAGPDTARRTVYEYPRRIAIITDKGVASAAEAFIMEIKKTSSKVIVYGENTYGMIDYMNINTIPFGCPENKLYYFGYPTFFSKEIKTHPINPTGLKPDIYIPPQVMDWIQWVASELKKTSN